MFKSLFSLLIVCVLSGLQSEMVFAGVFNIPTGPASGAFSVGLEPEVVLDTDRQDANSADRTKSGGGINLRYTYGLSDVQKVGAILGTGGGARRFRVGGNMTFDIFPDYETQPGLGVTTQVLFVDLPGAGSVELTGIPYAHKNFDTAYGYSIEPFLALPIGLALTSGKYQSISSVVVGAQVHHTAHWSSIVEAGVSLGHGTSYLSGGFVYYN